jgi:hypothetical protein
MQSYSVVCVSTKNSNAVSDSIIVKDKDKSQVLKLDFSSVRKLDFTHALINNGVGEYKLELKSKVPEFNEVKNAWTLSHTYWRHDEPETNGFQNLEATIKLLIKSLDCAQEQKLNIKHCQSIEILLPECEKDGKNPKTRIISLVVKKLKNGNYDSNTNAIATFCTLN